MLDRLLSHGLALVERALRVPWIAEARSVVAADAEAGGSLLAAALAYRALFGLLSGLVCVAGLIGWLFEDPTRRADAVATLATLVPGVEPVAGIGLDSFVAGRGALSILGLVGAAWGASAFYDALDGAINRVLPGLRERNPFERRLRGIGAVVVLALSGVLALGIGVALPTLQDVVGGEPLRFLVGAGEVGLTVAVLWAGVVTIYRLVPTAAPSLSAAGLPALAVGCGIWLAAQAYALLTPLLVGGLAVFGVFVSLFGLLIWLGWVSQLLLLGASWTRVRRDGSGALIPGATRSDGRSGAAPTGAGRRWIDGGLGRPGRRGFRGGGIGRDHRPGRRHARRRWRHERCLRRGRWLDHPGLPLDRRGLGLRRGGTLDFGPLLPPP